VVQIRRLIEARKLTQAAAAKLFGVTQPRVSDLVRGRIELFSIDGLVNMLRARRLTPRAPAADYPLTLQPARSSMRATGIAAAAIVLLGCQQAAETPEQRDARIMTESAAARTAIEARNAEFMTHFNQGHGEVVAGYYAEDGAVMAPNVPAVEGRKAIQDMVTNFAAVKAQVFLTTKSVVANGPLAIERGNFRMTFMYPGATAAVADTGKYLVHWRNVGGQWFLVADMFNSDLPMAAPPPAKK